MFTRKELNIVDPSYFRIINCGVHTVTIQSKNTQHCWHIIHQSYPHFSSCEIHHRHNEATSYHVHGHAPTLEKAIENIKNHDTFQLNGRKKSKNK